MSKSQVEQTMEEFGTDVEAVKKSYEGNVQKIIPKEWYFPIIDKCIKLCDIVPENVNHNKHDRVITVMFDGQEKAEDFELKFHTNVLRAANEQIRENEENPKEYNRSLILETTQEGISFTIRY